ncbi:MAG TPA: DNA gyrase subunit A [Bryobacteraceae bacterium]|jgi:DNA gyrase subunit A|nr:DNA gyrase subunit A [Bryobacteraceae bacterium]
MPDQDQPSQLPLPGGGDGGGRNILPTNIEDEMKRSYLDYAMSVIVGRALPDIRDGLKPVHRRILYTMHQMGLQPNRPTRKCARIVGDVMGKYHPHGNLAVYDALVRLAQPFALRYPLVEGQGNFGSVDGDPPAADRYTEARLSRISTALLEDLDLETVDFKPNYDDSEVEPEVLPTRVPNLLVNGSSGIAVGMATNIPPHNLTEIISATIQLIQHPNTPLQNILEMVPGPDFPTGGYILGRNGIYDAYTKGRGQLKLRAKAAIERTGKDREQIVVTEIPYQVNKSKLLEQIASMVNEKRIEGISDVFDHSDREGMRIVIDLKRGEQAEVVLNNLYKHTQLQIGFGIIMLSIVNGQPRELGLVDCLKHFIDHRVEVVRRRTEYELRKARDREHILLGFQKALDNLDEVIRLIRASKSPREARDSLIGAFQFTERQAQAIIELQLQRLTGMERQKIIDELADIQRRIAAYLEILGSDTVLRSVIIKELKEVQKDFGDERRTQIIEDTGEIKLEDLVAVEDVAITVTRGGYLKRTSVDTYRRQIRGGKGRIGMGTRAEDVVEYLLVASTHSYLLIFTSRGRVFWLKAYEIPDASTTGKGKHISNMINLQGDETVKAFLAVKDFVADRFIVMVTKKGVIKKCELTEFDNPMSRGIIAMSLDEGDELIGARITDGKNFVFLGSRQGQAIRFPESEVRAMGRPAHGVWAMDLANEDYLIGMEVVEKQGLLLSIAENGFGKRTSLEDYRLTRRGGKGVINMKTTSKTGSVVAILSVSEDSDLIIVTQAGKIIRIESSKIRQAGRSTQGVKLVSLEDGDKVAAASVIPDTDPTNGNGNEQETLLQ